MSDNSGVGLHKFHCLSKHLFVFTTNKKMQKKLIYLQLCDKSISRLRRHAKLSGCSLLMFEKL